MAKTKINRLEVVSVSPYAKLNSQKIYQNLDPQILSQNVNL